MGYTAMELARLSGVTTRALRFYEQKGLLMPKRKPNGYRTYEMEDVDRLQEILFLRSAGMPVERIAALMLGENYDREQALCAQLEKLTDELESRKKLIATLQKTLAALRGGERLNDMEKFEGLKEKLLKENEQKYGAEIREKYGDETVEASNKQFMGMSREQYERAQALSEKISQSLLAAMEAQDPTGPFAQAAYESHREWLCLYWPKGHYSKEKHKGLAQMYVDDERFKAYYDQIAPDAAVFLKSVIDHFCE